MEAPSSSSCDNCKAPLAAAARFCGTCGSPSVAGAVATVLPEWQRAVTENFFRGRVVSRSGREVFSFENGLVRGPDGAEYAWLGNALRRERANHSPKEGETGGFGAYDGRLCRWYFPDSPEPFYSFSFDGRTFQCLSMAFGPRWNYVLSPDGRSLSADTDQSLEGADTVFEVAGELPFPVLLFAALFVRASLLHSHLLLRLRRRAEARRCDKLVLAAGTRPRLCAACAAAAPPEGCLVCEQSAAAHPANLCKHCAPKKGLCAKCGDPLKGSQTEGKLCGTCGLGSRGMNCARLVFGSNI